MLPKLLSSLKLIVFFFLAAVVVLFSAPILSADFKLAMDELCPRVSL